MKKARAGKKGLLAALAAFALLGNQMPAAEPVVSRPVTEPTLKAASAAAAAEHSLVLLVFSATWCGPCKMLKSQTLDSPEFLDRAGALHIVDVDVDADQEAARAFNVSSIPALFLLTGDGKIVSHQVGFTPALDLIGWIEKARVQVKAGEWEGTAPGARFDEFVKKAGGDGLSTNDLQRLIAMLGDSEPGDRATGAQLILAQREQAVPVLISAIGDSYLGTRISASDLLQQLAPGAPISDPWQSSIDLSNSVMVLKKWWSDTGKLPPPRQAKADAATENSIKAMIEGVRGDNLSQRTDSMADLVRQGSAALPEIREAIRKNEHLGDQRSVSLLEDVRWAILVPDALEQESGGVRNVLARGKSSERQDAAMRLGKAGRDGLNALTELLGDSDPLVVESAIREMSGIGGKDAIPALAVLLQAGDSNLRMTAAQALGHTKNPDAIKPLLAAFIDPNEVVACTALSALEEIRSRDSEGPSKQDLTADAVAALRTALADTRWRVRATAAQIIGKIRVVDLSAEVKKLLNDPDSFVAKSALTALNSLGAPPDEAQLAALGKRLPSLRTDTVQMMLESETDDTIKAITDIFNSGSVDDQLSILNAMALKNEGAPGNEELEERWKPLLNRASTATDPRLRRAAATVLSTKPLKLAAELVGPLLADDDSQTRATAAGVVLGVLNGSTERRTRFGWTQTAATGQTNKAVATPQLLASWHAALVEHADTNSSLEVAAAVFATGDGKSDLPLMEKALVNVRTDSAQPAKNAEAVKLLISKLPWPEGKALLDKLCESPLLFVTAASQSRKAAPEIADYLFEPSRFKKSVEPLAGSDLRKALDLVAGYSYGQNQGWSLWTDENRTRAIDLALVESTNAAWRSAAVFSLGYYNFGEDLPVLQKATTDPNLWVRAAGVSALARKLTDRVVLEQSMGPLVADKDLHVAAIAACALLEPEVRQASDLNWLDYFQFEGGHNGGRERTMESSDRPLTVSDGKPAFLQSARNWLSATNAEYTQAFALLLAQYGEFDGIDKLLSKRTGAHKSYGDEANGVLLAGIGLSHDSKYVPALREISGTMQNQWDLQKILQAMRGMTGPEARQLRLDINRKIRQAGNGQSGFD